MPRHVLAALLLATTACSTATFAQQGPEVVEEGPEQFEQSVLVTGLEGPWELTWGPDEHLWVTERTGKRVVRIDPADGTVQPAVTIDEVEAPGGQDGLLGMALHPELLQGTGNDYVYVAYTYNDESEGEDPTITDPESPYLHLYTKLVRLTYNEADGSLGEPVDLITGLPASNDHNSGRLKFGPDGKLYYTIGDQGNNQLGNVCIPIEAQRLPTEEEIESEDYIAYVGKSLRLEPDGSIPEDNPEFEGVTSHVYTYGHRNMQGIDFGPDGTLYAAEHGPKTDDEINILQPGENYGWPHVAGFRDDMAYQYARWSEAETPCEQLEFSDIEIHPSVPREDETDWEGDFVEPIATMFTVPDDYDFTDPICEGIDFICWPTVAVTSIEYYGDDAIPGWQNSLLIPTLKRGSLYRLPLTEDGQEAAGPVYRYFQSENRFRDIAVAPDGATFYIATDPSGLAEAIGGGTTTTMQNPGAILVFTHEPDAGGAPAGEAESEAPAADEAAAVGDDDARPAGERLPPVFTEAQADRGKTAYNSNCAVCHGSTLTNGTMGTPLAGTYFRGQWGGRSVLELYEYAHTNMPPSNPGSLPDQSYADIVAYVLRTNGIDPGDTELGPEDPQLAQQIITLEGGDDD